jgi:hypothetical protein
VPAVQRFEHRDAVRAAERVGMQGSMKPLGRTVTTVCSLADQSSSCPSSAASTARW